MVLPRASDLDEEPTIDWNKVLDNMRRTPLSVKFKLAVCPCDFCKFWQWVTSSVYAQYNVFCVHYRCTL